jgi:hypothetical protein
VQHQIGACGPRAGGSGTGERSNKKIHQLTKQNIESILLRKQRRSKITDGTQKQNNTK